MPSWDKDKAHEYYIKHRQRLRKAKRERYMKQKLERRKDEAIHNSRAGSLAADDKRDVKGDGD